MTVDPENAPSDFETPSARVRRRQRARIEAELLLHRLRHPVATAKAVASRVLPYRVRRAILRALGRARRPPPARVNLGEGFVAIDNIEPGAAAVPRPTILCLPVIDWSFRVQRPHHLMCRLAARGWPVLYAATEVVAGRGDPIIDPMELAPGVHGITIPAATTRHVGEEGLLPEDVRVAIPAVDKLVSGLRIHQVVVVCQSPGWRLLAIALRELYGWPVVYDRIDLHEGFSTTGGTIADDDHRLVGEADLVTATAAVLARSGGPTRSPVLRLPNACDPEHWVRTRPAGDLADLPRPVVGYFGAISEWFDSGLVEELALARPGWSIVLIGSTWGGDVARLQQIPNVHLLGERPYGELPALASAFDVGVIPFKQTPLTEATDPVKLYEMMALGLEVVAAPLPEISRLGDLVLLAEEPQAFVQAVELAAARAGDEERAARRREFAHANSWAARCDELEPALAERFPRVTIGIVTYNNRELTELCLESIVRRTIHPRYEVVVVDNASTDGTARWLEEDVARRPGHRVILNDSNRGFAAACNQAFEGSTADMLCFLNNDTVVTRGWLATMVGTLSQGPEIGLVGPSSNGVANEARVAPGYSDLSGLEEWAEEFVWTHRGESFSIPMLALFCAVLRRSVWEAVGGLDERFEVGMFEDDDFSRRIRRAGFDVRCRRDAWVHHHQEASFGLLPAEEYERIYESNRRRYQEKWRGGDGQS
jgi:GT2 family glycosyltransferase/glycosyltransferase involved in cell wall biosynthesis